MNRSPILMFFASIGILVILFMIAGVVLMVSFTGKRPNLMKTDSIGVLPVEGIILNSDATLKTLKKFSEDDSIKAILVRIDSPGGVVGPSQEIYQELIKVKRKKKVVASMESLGASGAFYIALAADKIIANPGTLTGSIGVIMEFPNYQKLFQWAKLEHTVIKSGKYKDVGSPFRPMTPEEKEYLDQLVLNVNDQFKHAVSVERKLDSAKLDQVADGRIFTGEQAKKLGLIDQLGNFSDSVDLAKELSGIKGKPELVYPDKERNLLLRYLVDDSTAQMIEKMVSSYAPHGPLLYLMPAY